MTSFCAAHVRAVREYAMDLGIAGRKAIVCASSKGLGRACATSLAAAGCEVVVNGRNRDVVEAAAADIRQATGATVIAVTADVATAEGQKALFDACPEPDIVVNNNAGPPFRDFRELSRQQIIDGVIANMVVAIEITQKAIDPMVRRNFGRIVNITSGTVKAPLVGLDLSSGARAGLTAFMAGVARSVAGANVTINFMQPGAFATERLQSNIDITAAKRGITAEQATKERLATIPAKRFGAPDEFGAACAFLCSAHAGFITGQNLLIDGGTFPGAF
jgi:3-oxoacyl-[acyl-carrier protein] reductase